MLEISSWEPRHNASLFHFSLLIGLVVLLLGLPIAIVVSARDLEIGSDTLSYYFFFQQVELCGCVPDGGEPLFGYLARIVSAGGGTYVAFFGAISLLQFAGAAMVGNALSRILGYSQATGFVLWFLALLVAFPMFSWIQLNVLRQGISFPFVVLAAIALYERRWKVWLTCALIAIGFHYSSVLYLLSASILLISSKKRALIFWGLVIAYVVGASELVVQTISDISGVPLYTFVSDYGASADYQGGIRFDFLLFSLTPLVLVAASRIGDNGSSLYRARLDLVWAIYAVHLVPFLLLGWAAFSDRYALTAWLLFPTFLVPILLRFVHRGMSWIYGLVLVFAFLIFIGRFGV